MKIGFNTKIHRPTRNAARAFSLLYRGFPIRARAGNPPRMVSAGAAFTLIEIAIALGVIAFALVAIIGVLPMGMNVQKENREETIINQDAAVLMNAICNGESGVDDLANYAVCLTNFVTTYNDKGGIVSTETRWYTRTNSSMAPPYPLATGRRIVGLLSTPKYIPVPHPGQGGVYSNYVVAVFRSMSGPASDKFPQDNPSVRDFAFTYKVIPAVLPIAPAPGDPIGNANLKANLHDVRLTFRWPVLGRNLGNGRQVYRSAAGGQLIATNEPGFAPPYSAYTLHFFEPRNYAKVP